MYAMLYVERGRIFRKIVGEIARIRGIQFFEAEDIDSAFEILDAERIDIILTGLELKQHTGQEFIKKLNASKHRSVPIVVITSTDSVEKREELFNLGVIDYIPKAHLSTDRFNEYLDRFLSEGNSLRERLKNLPIAVLDDSEFTLKTIRHIFTMNDIHNVKYFQSAEDLFKDTTDFSVYLIDVILPHTSGKDVVRKIRENDKYSVIICISVIDHYKIISEILDAGANDYIMKPFDARVFMARINSSLRIYLLVQELEDKKKKLQEMAVTDSLTGLYNHRHIFERLEEMVENKNRYGRPVAIVMFDIDRFKSVNDNYGHQEGDKILAGIGKFLKKRLRKGDIIGRYGGEEFMLILPEAKLKKAVVFVEKLRNEIQIMQFSDKAQKITLSGGCVEIETGETASHALSRADTLLYKAKESGRNRVEYS